MTKSTITRATTVAVSVGLLAGSAAYEGFAQSEADPKTGTDATATTMALARPTAPDDVVVVVNGHEVTRAEVDREIDAMLGGRLAMVPEEQLEGIRAQLSSRVTEGVIVKTLLEEAAEKQNVSVDDRRVTDSIEKIEATLPEGKTIDDYLTAMGTTSEEFSEQLAMSLRVEKLIEQKTGEIEAPSDSEVAAFYDGNDEMFQAPERAEVSHILIAVARDADEATKADKRKQAEAIRAELVSNDGADFATIAGLRSDCPSKADGGNLGVVARGDTVAAFEEAVFSQRPGEIGPVVETPFGYHVVRVDRQEPAGKVSMADARPFIEQRLAEQKQQAAVEKFIGALRANADVVYPAKEAA